MPTETKNSTAKASRSGSVSVAARWLSSDSLRIMPAKNAPEREGHVEQHRRAEGDAERDGEHGQAEQLARAGMRHVVQDPRDHALAHDQHDGDEGGDLGERDRDRKRERERGPSVASALSTGASAGSSTSVSTIARSSTMSQPTAMRPRSVSSSRRSCIARSSTTVLATDKRQAEHEARAGRPAEPPREHHAERGRDSRSARSRRGWRCARPTAGPRARNAGRRRTSAG